MTAPKVIWVTHEDSAASWRGAYRVFRASSLDHGSEYPCYIRADAPELVALVDAAKNVMCHMPDYADTAWQDLAAALAAWEALK